MVEYLDTETPAKQRADVRSWAMARGVARGAPGPFSLLARKVVAILDERDALAAEVVRLGENWGRDMITMADQRNVALTEVERLREVVPRAKAALDNIYRLRGERSRVLEVMETSASCNECDEVGISVECSVCGMRKKPIWRCEPPEMANSLCNHECPGYDAVPLPCSLWPGERWGDSLPCTHH